MNIKFMKLASGNYVNLCAVTNIVVTGIKPKMFFVNDNYLVIDKEDLESFESAIEAGSIEMVGVR